MSECADISVLMQGLLDGELDAEHALQCETHLSACPECAAAFAKQRMLRDVIHDSAPRYAAPSALRRNVERAIARAHPASWRAHWSDLLRTHLRPALLAPGIALAAVALLVFTPRGPDLAEELVTSHVRSLQESHLMDVVSTDRHTVKPWFAGRIDYAPQVVDLAPSGFPLVGGRLDYVAGRPVAVLVYRRGAHVINVFVFPADRQGPFFGRERDGYHFSTAEASGMRFIAVSDVNAADLKAFAAMLASAAR